MSPDTEIDNSIVQLLADRVRATNTLILVIQLRAHTPVFRRGSSGQ